MCMYISGIKSPPTLGYFLLAVRLLAKALHQLVANEHAQMLWHHFHHEVLQKKERERERGDY